MVPPPGRFHLESWWPDIYRHMTSYISIWRSYAPISHAMSYGGIWPSYAGKYSLQKYMLVYDRHIPAYTFPKKYMPVYDGHMLQESSTVYGGIWSSYDSLWWKMSIFTLFTGHSFCCARYKTCHTGRFCFCTWYMTSCDWYMLAHPALPSFVPCCTRLARLNARLKAAHSLLLKLAERHARSRTKQLLVFFEAL